MTNNKFTLGLAGAALAAGLALAPTAAFAHVSVDPSTAPIAGESTTLTFGINHGCDSSPTTKVAVSMPDGLSGVHPIADAGWTIDVERDGDAGRVSTVTYTAVDPLPDDVRGEVKMQVGFADDASGALVFPVEQTCEAGSFSWSEVAQAGQDEHDLEAPAPTLVMATPESEAVTDEGIDAWTIASAGVSVFAFGLGVAALTVAIRSARRG